MWIGLALVGILSLTALSSNSASASTYSDMSRGDKLVAFEYARMTAWCYSRNFNVETNRDKVADGQLFYDQTGAQRYVWTPIKGMDGLSFTDKNEINCGSDDDAMSKAAFERWGIDDPLDFI